MSDWLEHVEPALSQLARDKADPAQYLLRHGTMRAGLYAPGNDDQHAHDQDELYIIRSGSAKFHRENDVVNVEAGHFIFVRAGTAHHFEEISSDFVTYVVFWGPHDGEPDRKPKPFRQASTGRLALY